MKGVYVGFCGTIHRPAVTAVDEAVVQELAAILRQPRASLRTVEDDAPGIGACLAAILADSRYAQQLSRRGTIDLHNRPPDHDAFEVLVHDGRLLLLGNTPRGLLQAAFALREHVASGKPVDESLHLTGAFQFPFRIFHQRFDQWPGTRADVAFIARLGASHCLVCHDWNGSRRNLHGYVTSDIFPDACDPGEVAANAAALRELLDNCKDYGLGAMLWITELPCQGGPWVPEPQRQKFLQRFPAEVRSSSGTYEGEVLCFSTKLVQDFYRDCIRRFFARFPEIETLFLFGLDASGEFCDPDSCPRCRGMSRFQQRDRLIRFLIEEGQRARPGLRVLTTGWKWDNMDPAQFLARQSELPESAGLYLAAQMDGWQCERQSHDLLRSARAICRRRGQWFIGYDNFHWGDDSVHHLRDIQDFPLGVGAKLRRWQELGADGIFDHWGTRPEDLPCNALACRALMLNPLAEPEPICRDIARQAFGQKTGGVVFEAWTAIELAHRALSNACTWSPWQWPGWYPGSRLAPIPGELEEMQLAERVNSPRMAAGIAYNPPQPTVAADDVANAWNEALPHLATGIERLTEAMEFSGDAPLGHRHWWLGAAAPPTQREHLRRQRLYLESVAVVGRDIALTFAAWAMYTRMGCDASLYRKQARTLLLDAVDAAKAVATALYRWQAEGLRHGSAEAAASAYLKKARRVEQFLRD